MLPGVVICRCVSARARCADAVNDGVARNAVDAAIGVCVCAGNIAVDGEVRNAIAPPPNDDAAAVVIGVFPDNADNAAADDDDNNGDNEDAAAGAATIGVVNTPAVSATVATVTIVGVDRACAIAANEGAEIGVCVSSTLVIAIAIADVGVDVIVIDDVDVISIDDANVDAIAIADVVVDVSTGVVASSVDDETGVLAGVSFVIGVVVVVVVIVGTGGASLSSIAA
jgi:hypothetical protein